MLLSTPAKPRFLLDENVRCELDAFLKHKGFVAKRLSKGAPDQSLAAASQEEDLIIVTNDEDFVSMPSEKVFSVVLLRISQRDVTLLLSAFQKLLGDCEEWRGRMIILSGTQWKMSPLLPRKIERGKLRS